MRLFFVLLVLAALVIDLVCSDESVDTPLSDEKTNTEEENSISVKIKRGIHNYANPYGYNYFSYAPYSKYSGISKGLGVPGFAITPGNAIVHSFNVNYPRIYVAKPFQPITPQPNFVHPRPILPVSAAPVYAKRFPLFVQKSLLNPSSIPVPFVTRYNVAPLVPHSYPINTIPISNILPQSTLDGWKPTLLTDQSDRSIPLISSPTAAVLPSFTTHSPSHLIKSNVDHEPHNYYLPPDLSLHGASLQPGTFGINVPSQLKDQNRHKLHAHLQHLQYIEDIKHSQNSLRNEQNDIITPLSEQGYETASNNGRYSGPSSYEVQLSSRG